MPVLYRSDGASASFDSPEDIRAALAAGWEARGPLEYTTPITGAVQTMTPEQQSLVPLQHEYGTADNSRHLAPTLQAAKESAYSGAVDQGKAFLEGGASIGSFGTSDFLLKAFGADTANRQELTAGRGWGEAAGLLATIATPVGLEGAAGKAVDIAAGAAGKLSRAVGAVEGGAARLAAHVGEGAMYGIQQELAQVDIRDPDFTAEAALAHIGTGALLNGALGGVGHVALDVLPGAVRRKFSSASALSNVDGDAGKVLTSAMADHHGQLDDIVGQLRTDGENAAKAMGNHVSEWRTEELGNAVRSTEANLAASDATRQSAAREATATAEEAAAAAERRRLPVGLRRASDALSAAVDGSGPALTTQHLDDFVAAFNKVAPKGSKIPAAFVEDIANKAAAGDMRGVEELLSRTDNIGTKAAAAVVEPAAAQVSLAADTQLNRYGKRIAAGTAKEADYHAYLERAAALADEHALPQVAASAREAVAAAKAAKAAATEHIDEALRSLPTTRGGREALGLLDSEKMTGATFKNLSEQPPAKMLKQLQALSDYHEGVLAAAKGNAVYEAKAADAIRGYQEAVDGFISPGLVEKLNPKVINAVLGVSEQQAASLTGSGGHMLRVLTAFKLSKGLGVQGVRKGLGGLIRNIQKGIMARGGAGMAVGMLSHVIPGVGPIVGGIARGAAGAVGSRGGTALFGAAEAKAASRMEQTADEYIEAAIGRITGGAPRPKPRMRPLIDSVLNRLLPDSKDSKLPQAEKYKKVSEQLRRYQAAPDAAGRGLYEALRPMQAASEHLADSAEMALHNQYGFLGEKLPHDPGTNVRMGVSRWQPTDRELYEFANHASGALFPFDTIDAIADGNVSPQACEALKAANPAIFRKFQAAVMENAEGIQKNATYSQGLALTVALGVPLEPTAAPRYVQFVQSLHVQQTQAAAAAKSSNAPPSQTEYSDAQKLLA